MVAVQIVYVCDVGRLRMKYIVCPEMSTSINVFYIDKGAI